MCQVADTTAFNTQENIFSDRGSLISGSQSTVAPILAPKPPFHKPMLMARTV